MAKSSQKFIARNRPPRVQINYDVERYGAEQAVQLPFVIGVMADLSGSPAEALPPIADRRFVEFDIDNFEDRLRSYRPRVAFGVPDTLTGEGELEVDLAFESMDDFDPGMIAAKVEPLNRLLQIRRLMASLLSSIDGRPDAEDLLAKILGDPSRYLQRATGPMDSDFARGVEQVFQPKSERVMEILQAAVTSLADQALRMPQRVAADVAGTLQAFIDDVDGKLTEQINLIVHHPDFQALEGRWRGLHYLVGNIEADRSLKIRVLNLSQLDLGKTLRKYTGTAWDQSPIFKKLYEEEFGQLGGEPYGCLLGDYFFGHRPADVELLGSLAQIAAAVHAPFIAGASPSLMNMDSWQEISNPRDLSKIFKTVEYVAWRSLRESEDSKYLALAMPRFLARLPYGVQTDPVDAFCFEERIETGSPESYVWCNAAYGMGVCIARAFKQHGWTARIRGVESGGLIDDLPVHVFPTEDGAVDMKSPTEVAITDRWEAELAGSGLLPLVHRKSTDFAAFISANSVQKPAEYDDPDITANAAVAARLPYLLACCRFAHYLKCIVRDGIGAYVDRGTLEQQLNDWIRQYVDPDPAISSEITKVTRPLADAQIVLDEIEGSPGHYAAKLFIRPHYQLEGLTVSNRLIVQLEHVA